MLATLKALLVTIGTNLAAMFLTKTVILWALKLAAKQTENSIDDSFVEVAEAAYEGDSEAFMAASEKFVAAIKEETKEEE
jgi:ABC-type anion transport system duplicated permease subunit